MRGREKKGRRVPLALSKAFILIVWLKATYELIIWLKLEYKFSTQKGIKKSIQKHKKVIMFI